MTGNSTTENARLVWRNAHEILWVEAWGANSLRVRSSLRPIDLAYKGALLPPEEAQSQLDWEGQTATLTNGKIKAKLSPTGHLSFYHSQSGEELLAEVPVALNLWPPRNYKELDGAKFQLEARFKAYDSEHIYGLGQHQHGLLDQKGCVIDLLQRNTEVAIPFIVSSRMYGFLWNNPALGRVEFGANGTRWIAHESGQLDYFVIAGDSYPEIMAQYGAATGYPPLLPEWAAGFWQSKLRYASQDEVLTVAREYRRRDLPLSGIIIDAYHWPNMGDMQFDARYWPDPAAMLQELAELNIKVMISIWPHLNTNSQNYNQMVQNGYFVRTRRGVTAVNLFRDIESPQPIYFPLYDPTNPEARQGFWELVRQNYYDLGIKSWWLDACEPEISHFDYDNLAYFGGSGVELGCIYPLKHQQTFFEGMKNAGEEEIFLLCRSAWAGSQRYGAAVWSGDIQPTFEALRAQVTAGLNIGLSGIPWWTTDIGGFLGGRGDSPEYRELMIRWFQYGLFCPLFRLHGFREPLNETGDNGASNEVWSYGEEAYAIIVEQLKSRERLMPYIMQQMRLAHETGTPPMRPLFFDFPADHQTYRYADQFMFGPDILVAPVLELGSRSRSVYLPVGTDWQEVATGQTFEGGQTLEVAAPLERIPVFVRQGSLVNL